MRFLGIKNVELHACGASSSERTGQMEIPTDADGENMYQSHVVDESESTAGRSVSVELTTLDRLLADSQDRVSLLKIDVEGHEWSVIQGATNLIRESSPALVLEINGDPYEANSEAREMVTWLEGQGYELLTAKQDHLVPYQNGQRATDYFLLHHADPRRQLLLS